MPRASVIPFGPQHPALLEPLHLKLTLEEERVVRVEPSLGYNHRGMEYAMEKDWKRNFFLSERVCGICSFHHSTTYAQALETITGVEAPERARLVRTIMLEVQRVTSHTLALGHVAEAMGYENLFMQFFREREEFMRIANEVSGNRVHYCMNWLGGVRRDISSEMAKLIESRIDSTLPHLHELANVIRKDGTWLKRTRGIGVLTKAQAEEWAVVGPMARASGLPFDARQTGNAAYALDGIKFKPIWREEGDIWARCMVRMDETLQSIELIRQCLVLLKDGSMAAQFKGNPTGEGFSRNEAPRGELMYWVRANGTAALDRVKVRTPAFMNIPPLVEMLPGEQFASVPAIVASVDVCICCSDR